MYVIIIVITKVVVIIMTLRRMNGYESSTNGESLFHLFFFYTLKSDYIQRSCHFYLYSVTLHMSQFFASYSVNRRVPDYDTWVLPIMNAKSTMKIFFVCYLFTLSNKSYKLESLKGYTLLSFELINLNRFLIEF